MSFGGKNVLNAKMCEIFYFQKCIFSNVACRLSLFKILINQWILKYLIKSLCKINAFKFIFVWNNLLVIYFFIACYYFLPLYFILIFSFTFILFIFLLSFSIIIIFSYLFLNIYCINNVLPFTVYTVENIQISIQGLLNIYKLNNFGSW